MKLWVLSDLHFEANGDRFWNAAAGRVPDADVCVLAGDVTEGPANAVEWARKEIAWKMPVVYVAGNHEFYGGILSKRLAEGRAASEASLRNSAHGVHLLENEDIVLDGVRFLGATLWTDFLLEGQGMQQLLYDAAGGLMPDYQLIWAADGRLITPDDTRAKCWSSVLWLGKQLELALPFNGPTVVVTHTAPSSRSIATRYEGSALNGSFVNNLDYMFEGDWAPTLWIHGHVHQAFDYRVNRTRVVCNPFGYASREDERENGFDWRKTVEV